MTTITLAYNDADGALAERIQADLTGAGYTLTDTVQTDTQDTLTIVILSQTSAADGMVQAKIVQALDAKQHVLPVKAGPVPLPRLLENLQPLDFATGYRAKALLNRVDALTGPDAPAPVVTHTPGIQRQNRRTAVIVGLAAGLMFVLAIIGVIAGPFQPPTDEFAGVETQIYLTRNFFIDEALPKSTEDALAFQPTVEAARETVQPFLILTATGIAEFGEATFYPRSTDEAVDFDLTLERVSTVVQGRMAATVTERAVFAQTVTPTPPPTNSGG
jgi:hypothetical protein